MPLIPIGTDIRTRRTPWGNYVLIALNVLMFLFTDHLSRVAGPGIKSLWTLYAAVPDLGQYLTYQFLHGDWWHLAGNMLFLWIFGNAVCDRMGSLSYVVFYLAGGVFAGVTFAAFNDTALLGASGSIAAVTTAFLVLFPRVHITLLFWMIVVTTIQVPAMFVIVFKIILWDNVIAPGFDHVAVSNVAYSAHLGGYAFGFLVALAMLLARGLPRNPFDLLALWTRWQRQHDRVLPTPFPRARPITVEEMHSRPLDPLPLTPAERLREEIRGRLEARDLTGAAEAYLQLAQLEPHQVLPRQAQLDVAGHLAQSQHHAQAASAYEVFLEAYPAAPDVDQVHLLLGLIYGRHLRQYEAAAAHLRSALAGLTLPAQRTLAENELRQVEAHQSGSGPDAAAP